mgnify:CR=1 FL=1
MEKKSEKIPCSLPETHNRLNQAFVLFQNIKDNYHEELEFTSHLNNIIQALRNVTFVLQKELAHTDGFNEWYQKQQKELKEDESLRWLVDARNYVVKEGDLKKCSYTKVRFKDHYERELFAAKLDPEIPMGFIADWFRQKVKIPDEIKDHSIIEAERIWIVEDFPKAEVVDVLIYCFGVLTNLVYLAHEQVRHTNALLCEKNKHVNVDEDYMVKLHNTVAQGRIVRILYSSGEVMTEVSTTIYRPSKKSLKIAEERYSKLKEIVESTKNEVGEIPFSKIPFHVEMAKYTMEVDGSILPAVFLYFPNKPPIIEFLGMSRPADRYLIFERIAEKVAETRCTALVTISEFWRGVMPKPGEKYVPASIQKKGEGIGIIAASPTRLDQYTVKILRDTEGKPILGKEDHNKDMNSDDMPSFKRIYDVWKTADWVE